MPQIKFEKQFGKGTDPWYAKAERWAKKQKNPFTRHLLLGMIQWLKNKWFDANWAKEKGLYTEVFETTEELDNEIIKLTTVLSGYNPEAMKELKKIIWSGTEEWDKLLMQRAAESGRLVLSKFTKNAIAKFKNQ